MTINTDDLRKIIFNDLELVKSILLTRNDIDLLNFIKDKNKVSPAMVADYRDVNVNNASTKLKRLFEQGYLSREGSSSNTGGLEYFYSVADVLNMNNEI